MKPDSHLKDYPTAGVEAVKVIEHQSDSVQIGI